MKLPRRTAVHDRPITPQQMLADNLIKRVPDQWSACVLIFDERDERIGGAISAARTEAVMHLVKIAVDMSLEAGAPDDVVREGLLSLIDVSIRQHKLTNSKENTDA